MAKKKKSKNKKKEKVCEIFKIEKKGKEEIKKVCGEEKTEISSEEQIKKQNKQLKQIFIGIGIVVLIFILIIFFIKSTTHFTYKGVVDFEIVKEGDLILYQTKIPIIYQGQPAEYNFYLRNDPRKLEKNVPIKGTLLLLNNAVINATGDFNCEGDGIIAIANLVNLYNVLGKNLIKDENASCDSLGRYTFLQIQSGNETSIEKTGPSCYNLNVNNCEILEVTERFIAAILARINIKET